VSVAPASDAAPAPKAAVFLSYAAADEGWVFPIAGSITGCGAAVFPDAACTKSDPVSHVLNALSFADEVLILITPTREESLKTRSIPAFLDRPYVWLAIGVATARGIPIRGLLKGMSRREVVEDQAIPRFIKDGELFEVRSREYEKGLCGRIAHRHPVATAQRALHCHVCLCQGGQNAFLLRTIERQLAQAGIVSNRWSPGSRVDDFHAAVVVFDGNASPDWTKPAFVSFLQSFFDVQKPAGFVTLPGQSPILPDWFRPAWRVEYRESDNLSFLQLVWTLVGYRLYDISVDEKVASPESEKSGPLRVFISYSHKDERLRPELETHLKLLQRQGVIAVWTDRMISAGKEWKGEIDTNLESADIILLLVSADFLASDYCYDEEMTRALERHNAGAAIVIPIILKAVNWQSAAFAKLQALPTDGKPVMLWTDRPSAWTDVAAGIRAVAEQIRSRKSGRRSGP
jgi:TIR domain-containing protein